MLMAITWQLRRNPRKPLEKYSGFRQFLYDFFEKDDMRKSDLLQHGNISDDHGETNSLGICLFLSQVFMIGSSWLVRIKNPL
ncbi:hypothetical protein AV530_012557 [Patagioenas fasciata monilis]|uniref:Uncharacterized protein n=1 Tax=Patagioenas fasciata monilis TaxID=372326 RepID=A0A1V4JCN8_PATFA|nr:hypothetical protein AV530_012557 [Patagioenas fasciata monilis]